MSPPERPGSPRHRRVSRFRPELEGLEDRLAPATLTVNDLVDRNTADMVLSLREAVLLVDNGGNASAALGRNLSSGEQSQIVGVFGTGDTIRFTSSASPRTITLTGGELLLSRGTTIIGPGPSLLTVSGNHASRVFEIAAGSSAKLDGLTIANGNSDLGNGGGVLNSGTLSVNNCVLTGNSALEGGGIYSISVLNMSGCTLTANAVVFEGGGILCSGIANLFNSTLDGNSADIGHHGGVGEGGGIMNFGKLTVSTCTLTNNSASSDGGGIVNWQASLTVIDSSLENNSATRLGGGIYSLGVSVTLSGIGADVSGSTLRHNTAFAGGGIYNTDGTLNLTDSTLNDNTASIGGAIDNSGQLSGSGDTTIASSRLTIGNSTLSGNAAAFGGGVSISAN